MATEVLMPQMGESIAEGNITRWLVAVGDPVERDQPLFEISTDKVDAEIPSPASGTLLEVRFQEGATVEVNDIVAIIGEEGEAVAAASEAAAEEVTARPESTGEEAAKLEVSAEAMAQEAAATEAAAALSEEVERARKFSSPVVRKIAAEHGVDISALEGSGIHGRVTKKDILSHIETGTAVPSAAATGAPTPAPATAAAAPVARSAGGFSVPAYTQGENVVIEPMSKIRQITSAHMTYSKATSAHVTTVFQMEFSKVVRARNRAKNGFFRAHGTKLTYMPFIFKAVASALKANPKVNASIDGTNIVFKKDIHLGMAVALERGLLVPVIRNADQLNLVGLAKTANNLAERARSKKLGPDELRGGTFTITNPGVFGSLFGMPIINQPQVAILGIGAIEKRPMVETDADGNDAIVIKSMSYFGISYDHRLVDGADADEFMNHVKRVLIEDSWSELDPFG